MAAKSQQTQKRQAHIKLLKLREDRASASGMSSSAQTALETSSLIQVSRHSPCPNKKFVNSLSALWSGLIANMNSFSKPCSTKLVASNITCFAVKHDRCSALVQSFHPHVPLYFQVYFLFWPSCRPVMFLCKRLVTNLCHV